jgi:CRISPR-associated protein Cas6
VVWLEHTPTIAVSNGTIDLSFQLQCKTLPVAHALELSRAIAEHLPWLEQEGGGVHEVYGGASGNGWQRPVTADGVLHLSARTRLILRVPRARQDAAEQLSDTAFDINGHRVRLGHARRRELPITPAVFARRVAAPIDLAEDDFISACADELQTMGIQPRKLLCGRTGECASATGALFTRALLVADLEPQESIDLQSLGLGPHRMLGCGLFVGHKNIAAVS